jgi:2-aminoethylphosphonate-pyruvate transaminase
VLIPMTGIYAQRMARAATGAGLTVVTMDVADGSRIDAAEVLRTLQSDEAISHVSFVYSETGTGIVHDLDAICAAARAERRRVIVDGIAAFGVLPLDVTAHPEMDAFVLTSNKCLESVPGLSFVVANVERLRESDENASGYCLDLAELWRHQQRFGPGYSRFTPPTQVIAALSAALKLFDQEGGPAPRRGAECHGKCPRSAGHTHIGEAQSLRRNRVVETFLSGYHP